jgi:hypothetical protein
MDLFICAKDLLIGANACWQPADGQPQQEPKID